jgi:hypothetical protein
LDLGKKYKFKKVVPAVAHLSPSQVYQNHSGRIVPTKMFDFLSLRGTNQNFVKPICLIDAKVFDFFFSWANRLVCYALNDRGQKQKQAILIQNCLFLYG